MYRYFITDIEFDDAKHHNRNEIKMNNSDFIPSNDDGGSFRFAIPV